MDRHGFIVSERTSISCNVYMALSQSTLVIPTVQVQFTGNQWFVLPSYFHPSVPTFFHPSQLRISTSHLPQGPAKAESDEIVNGSEGKLHLKCFIIYSFVSLPFVIACIGPQFSTRRKHASQSSEDSLGNSSYKLIYSVLPQGPVLPESEGSASLTVAGE